MAEATSYSYDPYGKRDPFLSFLPEIEIASAVCQVGPLECYELSEYMLVGTFSTKTEWALSYAIVRDPTGADHVLRVGDYLGKKWGQITSIETDRIEVTEEYNTMDGELLKIQKSLNLVEQTK